MTRFDYSVCIAVNGTIARKNSCAAHNSPLVLVVSHFGCSCLEMSHNIDTPPFLALIFNYCFFLLLVSQLHSHGTSGRIFLCVCFSFSNIIIVISINIVQRVYLWVAPIPTLFTKAAQPTSESLLRFTAVLFDTQNIISQTAETPRRKYITGLVLGRTRKICPYISTIHPINFKKCKKV